MAVQYIKEKTKQKYYLIAFGVVFLITIVVLWFGFFKDKFSFTAKAPEKTFAVFMREEIKINFDLLTGQTLKEMEVFKQISSFDGKVGREEPFKPVSSSSGPVIINQ